MNPLKRYSRFIQANGLIWGLSIDNIFKLNGARTGLERILLKPSTNLLRATTGYARKYNAPWKLDDCDAGNFLCASHKERREKNISNDENIFIICTYRCKLSSRAAAAAAEKDVSLYLYFHMCVSSCIFLIIYRVDCCRKEPKRMKKKTKLPLLLILFLVLVFNANAEPITPILATIKTIAEGIKVGNNVIDFVMKYPPILFEQILAAFDKKNPLPRRSYDFIVDLTRPSDIFKELKSYPITFPLGKKVYDDKVKEQEDRFIVNVVGRYNVGKTYVLRLLANINLGHSFTERTIGISVSLPSPKDTNGTPLALIDTAGTRTPVMYEDDTFQEKSYQRQVSDSFIQEIAFNSADIFVLVVNQMTLDDQLYLKTLTKRLKVRIFLYSITMKK